MRNLPTALAALREALLWQQHEQHIVCGVDRVADCHFCQRDALTGKDNADAE